MEALINWIMQIIVFILLAVIVELFVPSSKIAKYVRLVIGLIFLLILLKPVFYLFQIDMEKVVFEQLSDHTSISKEQTIDELIKQQNEQIQRTNDDYILTEVTNRLKEQAEDVLKEQFVTITHIDYVFTDESRDINSLEQLIVYVAPQTEITEEDIVVIDEIIIDLEEQRDLNNEESLSETKNILQNVWHLNDEEIIVKWGS